MEREYKMKWLKDLLGKAEIKEGKLDVDSLMEVVNTEFPKHAVPKETFNSLAETKKQLESDIEEKDKQLEEFKKVDVDALQKEIETHKLENLKTNIAVQANIPLELAGRLSGETEDEIKADAEKMSEFVNKKQPLPMRQTEPNVNDEDSGLKEMLKNMKDQ